MEEKKLLAASTRIVYSIPNLSPKMQLRWDEMLRYLFHGQLKTLQINDHEVAAALDNFNTEKDLTDFFISLQPDEQLWIIAALKLLLNYADEINDFYARKNLKPIIEKCTASSQKSADEITQQYKTLLMGFEEFNERRFFTVPASITLFSIDYFLRLALLIAYNHFAFDSDIVLMVNIVLFPPMILVSGAFINRKDRAYNEKLLQNYNYTSFFGFKFVYSTFQYTMLVIYLATGIIISAIVFESDNLALYLLLLVSYYYFLLQSFPTGRLDEDFLENQLNKKSNPFFKNADENDGRIVLLETQLNSNSGRLEAYVLESALFGALAFSAFLQIFATNLISFTDVEKFASNAEHFVSGIVLGKWDELQQNLTSLSNKESLFSLISIETLICSGLFVAVIASRLRFSQVADQLRTDLNLAKAYNEKEEKLLETNDQNILRGERFAKINDRVHQHLELAAKKLILIEPIVNYIVYFRNLGVFVFAAVLITSCLFISNILAWTFLLVGAATWIYFNLKEISTWTSAIALQSKIYFVKHNYRLLAASLLLFIPSYLLKMFFGFAGSDYLVSFSFLLVTVYLFVTLVQSYYDTQFGEIELLGWNAVKNIFGFSILLLGLSVSLINFHWISTESDMPNYGVILASISGLVIPFYLTKPRWPGIVWSFALGMSVFLIVMLIVTDYIPAEILEILQPVLFIWILFFIIYFRKKMFHVLFVRIALITMLLLISMCSQFFGWAVTVSLYERLELMYQHEVVNIDPLLKIKNKIHFQHFLKGKAASEDNIAKSIAAIEDYINKYGTRFGKTHIYRYAFSRYEDFASSISVNEKPDSVSLQKAYTAIQEADKISAMFKYELGVPRKAKILEMMGKKEDAIKYLQGILATSADDGVKKTVKKSLEKLQMKK